MEENAKITEITAKEEKIWTHLDFEIAQITKVPPY